MIAGFARSAILLATACCASAAAAQAPDAIVIRFRPSYGICAGLCPYFEIEVLAEGYVRTLGLADGTISRFDAKPRDVRRFTELMDRLRPAQDRQVDKTCERATLEGGSPDPLSWPRPDDIDVRWYSPGGVTRLTACASNQELRTALQDALRALGADPFSGAKAGDD